MNCSNCTPGTPAIDSVLGATPGSAVGSAVAPGLQLQHPLPVSIEQCPEYTLELLAAAVERCLQPLGGWETLVKPGMKVLLKPNLLTKRGVASGSTTHPALVQVVAEACRRRGATVFIGDSPPMALGQIEKYWQAAGLLEVAAATGATLYAFEQAPTIPIPLPCTGANDPVHINQLATEVDLLINLPKLKSHGLTIITGAVKNLFGLLPGGQKAMRHMTFPHPDTFARFLVELAQAVPIKASLTIMDAVVAMDGMGPAGGRLIRPGLLLASSHPVAIDLAFCALVGLAPERVPTLKWCRQLGYGPASLTQTTCTDATIERLRIRDYRFAPSGFLSLVPPALVSPAFIRLLKRLVKMQPRLTPERCISCAACARLCPAQAMCMRKGKPVIDRKRCISCFCCLEACPVDALDTVGSPLVNLYLSLKQTRHRFRSWLSGKFNK